MRDYLVLEGPEVGPREAAYQCGEKGRPLAGAFAKKLVEQLQSDSGFEWQAGKRCDWGKGDFRAPAMRREFFVEGLGDRQQVFGHFVRNVRERRDLQSE